MSNRCDPGRALDINVIAFAVITGAISGVTPRLSGWMKLKNVATAKYALSTTGTVNGLWTAQVATDDKGKDAIALPNPPTFPTGVASSGSPVITMPNYGGYVFLQLTFTPSAGAGNAVANYDQIVGNPVALHRSRQGDMLLWTPSTGTVAGTHNLDYSPNYDGRAVTGGNTSMPTLLNTPADPAIWFPACDQAGAAITLAAAAGAGQSLPVRLGLFSYVGIRSSFKPTAGAGPFIAFIGAKG